MIPTKIAFEERYSDDSGVEFAVRFNTTETCGDDKNSGTIEFECGDVVQFPADKLDWLLANLIALKRIAEL